MAPTRMIAIFAYSDGSIWKPPGSEIQDFAPLTMLPSGVSTTSRPRHDTREHDRRDGADLPVVQHR